MSPVISIVIPAYNAEKTLGTCLDSLEKQSIAREEYEIIVVDDGSDDSTSRTASAYNALVIRQAHRGPGAARNNGARVARGDILLFTDADCVPTPDWVERMLECFAEPDVVGVKGTYRTRQRGLVARFIQQEFEDKYSRTRCCHSIDFVDAYSAAYRREVFRHAGGFDEGFRLAEDVEFSYRLAALGYRMVFQPEAVVYHNHAESIGVYVRKKFWSAYWRSQAYRRFPSKALRDSTTPRVLYVQMPLAMLLLASAVGLPIWSEAVAALLGAGLGFIGSTAPFVARSWGRDRAATIAAPPLLLTRALALSAGLVTGVLAVGWAKLSERHVVAAPGWFCRNH